MIGLLMVKYVPAATYLKYEGNHLIPQKAGFELKRYGFENIEYLLFGAGWEGFEASADRLGNRVGRD